MSIQMRSCVQQKHMLRLETDLCSMGVHGHAFQTEDPERWKGIPYLVGTRVPEEN